MALRFQVHRADRMLRITSGTRAWEVTRRHWLPFSAASWVTSIIVWVTLVLVFCPVAT